MPKQTTTLSSLEQMASLVDDGTLSECIDVLKDKLKAKKRVRGLTRGVYEDVDDNSTQIKAAELLITFRLGRPAATNLNLNLNRDETGKTQMSAEQIVSQLAGKSDLTKIVGILQQNASHSIEVRGEGDENDEAIDI